MKLIDDTNGDIYDISENRMKHNIIGEINAIIAAGNEHDYSVQINNNIYDIKNAIDYIEKEWKI